MLKSSCLDFLPKIWLNIFFKGLLLKLKSFQHLLIKFKQILLPHMEILILSPFFLIQHLSLVPPAGWGNTGKLKLVFHSCYLINYKQFFIIFFKIFLYFFIQPQLFYICLSNTWKPCLMTEGVFTDTFCIVIETVLLPQYINCIVSLPFVCPFCSFMHLSDRPPFCP